MPACACWLPALSLLNYSGHQTWKEREEEKKTGSLCVPRIHSQSKHFMGASREWHTSLYLDKITVIEWTRSGFTQSTLANELFHWISMTIFSLLLDQRLTKSRNFLPPPSDKITHRWFFSLPSLSLLLNRETRTMTSTGNCLRWLLHSLRELFFHFTRSFLTIHCSCCYSHHLNFLLLIRFCIFFVFFFSCLEKVDIREIPCK